MKVEDKDFVVKDLIINESNLVFEANKGIDDGSDSIFEANKRIVDGFDLEGIMKVKDEILELEKEGFLGCSIKKENVDVRMEVNRELDSLDDMEEGEIRDVDG
ncbi:unnamed protein product [Dovyalis caffra]|uniref:Uncharacterized protein n=1 Tax=Dovyalis caffra TaxID=77055 RepID=A0AAV1RJK6_9ROSI|nr:unnamed protein product [Dovyalis caffra]